MSIRDFLLKGIQPLTVMVSLISGGLGGAVFTQWWTSRPANVQAQLGDYALAMGKPLLGVLIVLPNHGNRPGTVTSIELTVVAKTANRRTETQFESVFVSRQPENLKILPSGKLETTGDAQLSLFAPLSVSAGQTTSALVWFQPKSPATFAFDGEAYLCKGELEVWSGRKKEIEPVLPFAFTLTQYEADALNKKDQRNVLLPIRIQLGEF
jgi:hypothetical protein